MNSGEKNISEFLKRHRIIGLDSNILILWVERHPAYVEQLRLLFRNFDEFGTVPWVSAIAIPEVLTKPLRERKLEVVNDYEELIFGRQFSIAEIDRFVARRSALVGAIYNLKPRDSLHVASVLDAGATGFVTADRDFTLVKEPEVLMIG